MDKNNKKQYKNVTKSEQNWLDKIEALLNEDFESIDTNSKFKERLASRLEKRANYLNSNQNNSMGKTNFKDRIKSLFSSQFLTGTLIGGLVVIGFTTVYFLAFNQSWSTEDQKLSENNQLERGDKVNDQTITEESQSEVKYNDKEENSIKQDNEKINYGENTQDTKTNWVTSELTYPVYEFKNNDYTTNKIGERKIQIPHPDDYKVSIETSDDTKDYVNYTGKATINNQGNSLTISYLAPLGYTQVNHLGLNSGEYEILELSNDEKIARYYHNFLQGENKNGKSYLVREYVSPSDCEINEEIIDEDDYYPNSVKDTSKGCIPEGYSFIPIGEGDKKVSVVITYFIKDGLTEKETKETKDNFDQIIENITVK